MDNSVIFLDDQINIKVEKPPKVIVSILAIVMIILGVLPIFGTIILILNQEGLQFVLFLIYIVFWGSGFYLLRVILWNIYGQEILILERNRIIYIADYKLFKDGKKELEIDNLTSEIISHPRNSNGKNKLLLKNNSSALETVLGISKNEIDKIIEKINTCYNYKHSDDLQNRF